MAYLSPAYLQRYDVTNFSNRGYIAEAKTASLKASVFLSHSTADDEHVGRIVLFFREFGAVVYADNYDTTLPDPPNLTTAVTLRRRISHTQRFVVPISSNSRNSRWIPWELGIADGQKGPAQVAILPVTQTGTEEAWAVEKYFGLYPRIRQADGEWRVIDPRDNKYWPLNQSLTGQKMSAYKNPLSVFFVWHPLDRDLVESIFQECFVCLRRDVDRPFSRSANVPVFIRTCAEGGIPGGIDVNSRRSIIFAFIGKNGMSDDLWVQYFQALTAIKGADVVPIALDKTAFNFRDGIEHKNFIRTYEFSRDTFNERTCIAIFHEIYRYGLNESRLTLDRGKDSALKLFLSHAKDGAQGVAAAKALKQLIENGPMREFFDATDIAPGYEFEAEILAHIADSTLVAIHSDSYSSRYWCQREVLAAKDSERPIIAVDLIGKFEDRRFPLGANLPAIKIPVEADYTIKDAHLLAILRAALLESIRFCYCKQSLSEYRSAGWFPADAFLSARPPEACVLARLAEKIGKEEDGCLDFIYPDPPIYAEEAKHFEKFGLKPYTPLTSVKLDLSGKKLGVSISEPPDSELLKIGQTAHHLRLFVQDVARYALGYGAELIYGGDLRPGGFTEFLFQEGHALQSRLKSLKVHLTNHIAWPIHLADTTDLRDWKAKHRKVASMVEHNIPEDVRDLVASTTLFLKPSDERNSFVWSRSLTEMRKEMIGGCDFRISAGGRLTGYKGWMPGVLEEIALAIEMAKPVFLAGGFGGVTHNVCRMIVEKVVPEELSFAWQIENNPGLEDMAKFANSRGVDYEVLYQQALDLVMNADLRNGLSHEDNARLFATPFADEVIHLLLKGISQL